MPTLAQLRDFVITYQLPLYIVYCLFAGSLRAPTAQSSQVYVSFFAVVNGLAANLGRMFPSVEKSPNFEPAVIKRMNGGYEPPPPPHP
jgi:hypothetical protein